MATVLLTLCLQGSIALIPHAVILVKRIPWWLQLAAGAGAAIALAHPTSRAWLTSRWSPVIARILARVREESLRLGQEWAQLLHAAEAAEAWLTTVAREETPVQTELEAMMRVLVTTPTEHPLTPTELVHQMIAMGYDPPCEHPEITVGRLLHHYDRLFLQPVARHWCLRRV
jgi:hypothetical protein